ncbi:MAG: IscS subfamily cysteine desulfurase [Defluviitaleaceae bacterium]|nr:IscS subfamily cysteine desulfurase [Defluviitaleaceae bacterium]
MIYLDYAATTPISEVALNTYVDTAHHIFANSKSLHSAGIMAADLLELCRKKMATYVNGQHEGIIFTSGGTEANRLAIDILLASAPHHKRHIISTEIEHASIKNHLFQLRESGYTVDFLPVDDTGHLSLSQLKKAITTHTVLATIQYVNSEIGTVQPLKEVGSLLKAHHILFHSDCVQAFGKIPIDIDALNLDSLSVSSHKIYGPKGVGLCYVTPQMNRISPLPGTTHEFGFRPGTVDLPAIAAFTTASTHQLTVMTDEYAQLLQLKQDFFKKLAPFSHLVGSLETGLPHILGIILPGVEGHLTVQRCNEHNIMIATGSACSSGSQTGSHVIKALGRSPDEIKQFVRFSFGNQTTKQQLDTVAHLLKTMMAT